MENQSFRKMVLNHFKFSMYMLSKLPMGWLARLRVVALDSEKASVTIPFYYWTKNPFRSMYFAAQSMAAEMSTAVLALSLVHGSKPSISMLVSDLQATFGKKASTKITFTCTQGQAIANAVQKAKDTGEAQTVTAISVGTDTHGDVVSEFSITWSFKARTK